MVGEQPFVAAVDVRGGAPGTRETDLLAPDKMVEAVDALVLSGGSAFGLDAASGVADGLHRLGRGFEVGPVRVPLVPAAIIFAGVNIFNHIDDAYAQWGAADMVMDYMDDHNGQWPSDWESLEPYFAKNNGRVSGWSYSKFQSHVFIDFTANADSLRKLSNNSDTIPFDAIHAYSVWGSQMDDGPNGMLYRYFRDRDRSGG